jgi:phenylpropionate dioxygenase-like ring-hydroxylating dioxygenase large terminal subunit
MIEMAADDYPLIKGVASKASPLVEDLLKEDPRSTPALDAKGNHFPAEKRIDLSRYLSPAFAELEKEKLWKRVWQYACREEDIPNVGDRTAYSVGPLSYMIVRADERTIKAYANTCLHRGTRLCDGTSSGERIRCPFHGWEWNLDGTLHHIPSRWDFPFVKDNEYHLKEVKVGTWGGFIFINPDPAAGPLEDALGVLPEHFRSWGPEDHFTYARARKRIRANWKVTMEAFLESYHTIETHQQILSTLADASTQYEAWESTTSHVSRLYSPMAVPSPHLGDEASREAAALELAESFVMPGMEEIRFKIDPSSPLSARAQLAQWRRNLLQVFTGADYSAWPDALLLDAIQYWMFPNFCPWYGEGGPIVYQFLPDPGNPQQSIMDVRILAPKPGNGIKCPPPSPPVHLDFDESFTDKVPLFGSLSMVFDQDMANIPRVQAGLVAAHESGTDIVFGRYQEMRIRYLHEILDRQLSL